MKKDESNKRETIDSLIKKLQEARDLHGGNIEVWFDQGDGCYEAVTEDKASMLVIPPSKVYPEEKMFVFTSGEDTNIW